MYMMPSSLGSVVVSTRYTNEPLTPRDGGNGRVGVSSTTALTVRPDRHGAGPSRTPRAPLPLPNTYLTDYSPLNRFV